QLTADIFAEDPVPMTHQIRRRVLLCGWKERPNLAHQTRSVEEHVKGEQWHRDQLEQLGKERQGCADGGGCGVAQATDEVTGFLVQRLLNTGRKDTGTVDRVAPVLEGGAQAVGDLRLLATRAKEDPTEAVCLSCQQGSQDEDRHHQYPHKGGEGEECGQHPRRAAAYRKSVV